MIEFLQVFDSNAVVRLLISTLVDSKRFFQLNLYYESGVIPLSIDMAFYLLSLDFIETRNISISLMRRLGLYDELCNLVMEKFHGRETEMLYELNIPKHVLSYKVLNKLNECSDSCYES